MAGTQHSDDTVPRGQDREVGFEWLESYREMVNLGEHDGNYP